MTLKTLGPAQGHLLGSSNRRENFHWAFTLDCPSDSSNSVCSQWNVLSFPNPGPLCLFHSNPPNSQQHCRAYFTFFPFNHLPYAIDLHVLLILLYKRNPMDLPKAPFLCKTSSIKKKRNIVFTVVSPKIPRNDFIVR